MNVRRLTLALVVAFVLSVSATYAFYSMSRKQAANNAPPMIKVVAARSNLQAGTPLTADNVDLIEWPKNLALSGSFTKLEDISGRSLIYPVTARQPILEKDVAAPGSGIGLTVKIAEGMRAVSIRSNEIVGVAGFLYPGSRVDVLLTRAEPAGPVTRTILQNVEVLTAGQRIEPDPSGKAETVNVVTVLLSPRDSEKLVLASSQGSVQFVLRNGADQKVPESSGAVSLAELTGEKSKLEPAVKSTGKRASVKPQTPIAATSVEVIAGEKRTVETFR